MAKFRNAGQTCISANRLFVHKTIFDQFLEKLIEKIKSLKVGNGMDRNDIGPLISSESIKKIIQQHYQRNRIILVQKIFLLCQSKGK